MEKKHQRLIGKTKQEVLSELGFEFNYFQDRIWSYHIRKNWYGRKEILLLWFKDDIVIKISIKKSFIGINI